MAGMNDPVRTVLPPITVEPSCPPSPPAVIQTSAYPRNPLIPSPLASFAAEMFVWLWFAPAVGGASDKEPDEEHQGGGGGGLRMQFAPSHKFVSFCHDVLTTTQVSHSVVLLALLFVSRLKQRNAIRGSSGSEFRLAVTGLMLANKVLDDNTYTAKTWSQVSSLELKPLVEGEAEFLKGLNWSLHVTEREFRSFLKLLEGHVAARNARIGRNAPRKIASTSRVRQHVENSTVPGGRGGGGGELGLGISNAIDHLRPSLREDSEGSRNVRRRVEGAMSATSTPTIGFGTFSYPVSAPHPPALPLSSTPIHHTRVPSRPTSSANEVSPTSTAPSTSRSKKRNFDETTKPPGFPSLPHLLLPIETQPMSRSQSSSAAFSSSTPAYTPTSSSQPNSSPSPLPTPSDGTRGPYSRPPQLECIDQIHHDFNTLADSFSPRYDPLRPLHQRLTSLDYYSLAAGQGQGHLHQMRPSIPDSARHVPPRSLPVPYPSSLHPHVPPPQAVSNGGSVTSSPYSRPAYAPHKPSVLSGLRSSPPSIEAHHAPTRRPSQQQPPVPPPHPSFSYQAPLEAGPPQTQPSRRPSKVASSPGYSVGEDGTSTPRPSTGGSSCFAFDDPARVGLGLGGLEPRAMLPGTGPLSAGLPQYPPMYWPWAHQFGQVGVAPSGPWSAYANAGPPGVYWAAYAPQ